MSWISSMKSKRHVRTIVAAATIGAAALVGLPAAAQAADGNVYAYEHPYKGGMVCYWAGNDSDWSSCPPYGNRMINQASSLYNDGYPGGNDDVNFYWGTGYSGAWACLSQGDMWQDLTLRWEHFSFGAGSSGYGQALENNIASHKWVSYCGQP